MNFPHHHIIKLEMVPSPYGVFNPLAEFQEFVSVRLMFLKKYTIVLIVLHGLVSKATYLLSLLKTRQGNIFFSTMGRARISLPQSNEITKYRTWAVQCMTREYLKKYMWWPHDKERAAKGTSDLVWKMNCSRNACTNFSIQVPLYMIQAVEIG